MSAAGEAAIFRLEDHIRTGRRLAIDAVDTVVAAVISILLTLIAAAVVDDAQALYPVALLVWLAVWIAYFVVLKRSRFRTLGYVLAGARIVNLTGAAPSYLALAARLAFAVLGPFNFVVDLLWVSSDPRRQALRDKFAHTYVIRQNAVAIGTGRIVYRVYTVFGMTMFFAEVQDANESTPSPELPASPSDAKAHVA